MVKAFEDGDLGREVVLQLLVQLAHVDGFDGNESLDAMRVLQMVSTGPVAEAETYGVGCFVDRCEATSTYLLLLLEAASYFLRLPRPTRGLSLRRCRRHGRGLGAAKAAQTSTLNQRFKMLWANRYSTQCGAH